MRTWSARTAGFGLALMLATSGCAPTPDDGTAELAPREPLSRDVAERASSDRDTPTRALEPQSPTSREPAARTLPSLAEEQARRRTAPSRGADPARTVSPSDQPRRELPSLDEERRRKESGTPR